MILVNAVRIMFGFLSIPPYIVFETITFRSASKEKVTIG
jgi:hypothetical protein